MCAYSFVPRRGQRTDRVAAFVQGRACGRLFCVIGSLAVCQWLSFHDTGSFHHPPPFCLSLETPFVTRRPIRSQNECDRLALQDVSSCVCAQPVRRGSVSVSFRCLLSMRSHQRPVCGQSGFTQGCLGRAPHGGVGGCSQTGETQLVIGRQR